MSAEADLVNVLRESLPRIEQATASWRSRHINPAMPDSMNIVVIEIECIELRARLARLGTSPEPRCTGVLVHSEFDLCPAHDHR